MRGDMMEKKHETCVEVTNHGDLVLGKRSWMCGQGCPAADAASRALAMMTESALESMVSRAVEAERKRIRALLAAPLLEAIRSLPFEQCIVAGRVVDGQAARDRIRAAWREAFPLTDEVAGHLREVLKGEQP